jgi:hypothetical protein
MRCLLLVALAGTLALAPGVAAQSAEALRGRLDPASFAQVSALIDSAVATGAPLAPLVSKALEGSAKQAPTSAILAALRSLATQLRAARELLGTSALPAELEATAIALRSGVPRERIARLRSSWPDQPLTVALTVAADLVARGVPPADAIGAIETVAGRGGRDPAFEALRTRVVYDVGRGISPAASAAKRSQTVDINRGEP